MTTTLLRQEQEAGIEFFTVEATGESGMSQTCLGLLSGVSQSTISRLEKTLMREEASESLKPLVGKELTLMRDDFEVNGMSVGNLTIYRSEFCSAVIQHYAFKGNKVAQRSLAKFSTAGIDSWIQQQTGWHSKAIDSTSVDRALLIDLAQRVTRIESQSLPSLPPTVPEIPKPTLARKLVNEQAARTGIQHQLVWRQAYAELDYRFGYDISKKTCKGTKLQRIEEDGQLDNLIAIMHKLWTPNN
jgi:hypothetical protein